MEELVRSGGGVVKTRLLKDAGFRGNDVTDAVRAGRLQRPRRGWVAVPDADVHLVAAARAGVVLTCVTQARRLGLWMLEREERPHVAAPPHSGAVRIEREAGEDDAGERRALVHWAEPLVPRAPGALVDEIENVLALVAGCLPFEQALAVWESALNKQLVDALVLERLPLSARAREVLAAATPFSDSGLETFVVLRLRWLGVRIVPQAWIAGHRVDFLLGDRLVLQIDGGTHVGAQRTEDIRHDAQLALMGYHVIRVGYEQVVHDWPGVQHAVMRAVAQGLHRMR
ncbi:endonuclease domain-containing protein [Microbacterium sp. No. 7]|uniref:endonuclease domain-containing protein n=1 Tax=Microbacterium sp. No. 7 TaxID=1714373 RepID=UPI0006D15CF2|nr:DUF559 domain-containing protein [Microbacterium sp. No. 7]